MTDQDKPPTDSTMEAMAAMGLPTSFSTPSAAGASGRGGGPPAGPSPGNAHAGRGRRGRGRGQAGHGHGHGHHQHSQQRGKQWQGAGPRDNGYAVRPPPSQSIDQQPPAQAPSGPAAMQRGGGAGGRPFDDGHAKRKRGRHEGTSAGMHRHDEGPLVPLEEIPPLLRPSFTQDPWAHLD